MVNDAEITRLLTLLTKQLNKYEHLFFTFYHPNRSNYE